MVNQLSPQFSDGDIITWFCDEDDELHFGTVLYINKAMTATGAEINYEVEGELFGSPHTFFVDENNVITDL